MRADLPAEFDLRMMGRRDVKPALEIIRGHSQEDYICARQTYRRDLEDHYVLTWHDQVVGVTGARPIDGSDRAYWLSWTYLDKNHQGDGVGRAMLEGLLDAVRVKLGRKIFVMVSDLRSGPGGLEVYGRAQNAYRKLGFREELRHPDYYVRGEGMVIMGLRLEAYEADEPAPPNLDGVKLGEIREIVETDGAYSIEWVFTRRKPATRWDVKRVIERIRGWRGRLALASAPSDATFVAELFRDSGFNAAGTLSDFYEDGVDDLHFRYDMF